MLTVIRFLRHSTRYLDQPVPLKEQNSRVVDLLIYEGATIMPFAVPKLWTRHFYEQERETMKRRLPDLDFSQEVLLYSDRK